LDGSQANMLPHHGQGLAVTLAVGMEVALIVFKVPSADAPDGANPLCLQPGQEVAQVERAVAHCAFRASSRPQMGKVAAQEASRRRARVDGISTGGGFHLNELR